MMFFQTEDAWKKSGGFHTAHEILQQPETWRKTFEQIRDRHAELRAFIQEIAGKENCDLILIGAGTSDFIGNALAPVLQKQYGYNVKSYATTDITADPEEYLSRTKPTLLVSFARSGNSPESVAAVQLAEEICGEVRHLIITCNENGALCHFARSHENCDLIVLTPETNDQAFAMTSSFTCMYLAAYLAFQNEITEETECLLTEVTKQAEAYLTEGWKTAYRIVSEFDFDRIIYLGTGALKGIARESALKICELTQGDVDTVYDSPMGFRHGPKSVIKDSALCVVYLSDDAYTRQYEYDIIREMSHQRRANRILTVSSRDDDIRNETDYFISFNAGSSVPSVFGGLEYILAAQTLALFKSLKTGHMPDDPCPSGEVNRVVQGVTVYPYEVKQ